MSCCIVQDGAECHINIMKDIYCTAALTSIFRIRSVWTRGLCTSPGQTEKSIGSSSTSRRERPEQHLCTYHALRAFVGCETAHVLLLSQLLARSLSACSK